MQQDKLITLAQETLAICAAGQYTPPSGRTVSIARSLNNAATGTLTYGPEDFSADAVAKAYPATWPEVTNESTLSAILRLAQENPSQHLACLNFASARTPGGGFQRGTMAQEESLAYTSGLYPCLATQPDFYTRNRAFDSALYLDLAIFSPSVPFFRDDYHNLLEAPVMASVLTAAAPNRRALEEQGETAALRQIDSVLRQRAELVLALAYARRVDCLILGAWGCGVFANDPQVVARIFADLLTGDGPYDGAFERVVFATLDRSAQQNIFRAFSGALG
jgi:uncharacterized protein (TIGR02452 family)